MKQHIYVAAVIFGALIALPIAAQWPKTTDPSVPRDAKGGVRAASSMHVAFTTDEMAYRFTYRFDGSPLWHSALTPFKGSATQSPFVALSSASV